MTTLVIAALGLLVFYLNIKLTQAHETIADLRSHRPTQTGVIRDGNYYIDPPLRESYGHLLHKINQPGEHYSVGGTRPHMCICGKPLQEHR